MLNCNKMEPGGWVHQHSPELEKKIRRHLRLTNDSWRFDEIYIKVKVNGNIFTEQLTPM